MKKENMFPFPKRLLTVMLFIFLVIVASIFVYVQFLFIQKEKVSFPEDSYSKEYDCLNTVDDKESAKECFNSFFTETLENIREESGEDGIPESVSEMYEEISEEDIHTYEGEVFHITKDKYGKFYYIKDGMIVSDGN